jgi:hypothetical protein
MKREQSEITQLLSRFSGSKLTETLAGIEGAIPGLIVDGCPNFLKTAGADGEALAVAAELKRIASQINVTIHALGNLMCLPHILEPGERVEYVSLGAGNTGRRFDLETNRRVAEFKFIKWRGGAESIRQNLCPAARAGQRQGSPMGDRPFGATALQGRRRRARQQDSAGHLGASYQGWNLSKYWCGWRCKRLSQMTTRTD